jgi:hypothetical protein
MLLEATESARELRDALVDNWVEISESFLSENIRRNNAIAEQNEAAFQEWLGQQKTYNLNSLLLASRNDAQLRAQTLSHYGQIKQGLIDQNEALAAAEAKTTQARVDALTGGISAFRSMASGFGQFITDQIEAKRFMLWIDAAAEYGYGFATMFTNPLESAMHFVAATQLSLAAAMPTPSGGGGGGRGASGGSGRSRQEADRRRQSLEPTPDASLRSPSGNTFVILNDNRGAVGLDGERLGMRIMGVVNRSGRYRSGQRFNSTVTPVWRG